MAYPDNLFDQDQLDPQYGGEAATKFGGRAWTWITGWVRAIARSYLAHVRQNYRTRAVIVQDAVVIGDCLGMDMSAANLDGTAKIAKMSVIGFANARFIGVAADAGAAGSRVRVATDGPTPKSITLLSGVGGGNVPVSVNFGTNRLKLWVLAEVVVGYSDPQGNVLLTGAIQ